MTRWATTLLAAIIAIQGAPAAAQMGCGQRDKMIRQLDQEYGETRLGVGIVSGAVVIEVWTSSEAGTWTILKSYVSGLSCVMAVGKGWQNDPPVLPGTPS